MSVHIGAKPGDIARTVLMPGDPLRAAHMAETLLEDATCYNEVRGMYGYTGTYKGKRVSIQGSGMGMPSIAIYANELVSEYGVQNLIRVGSCGALQPDLKLRDVVIAMSASTDSNYNRVRFNGLDFAATASFPLLLKAYDTAVNMGLNVRVGNIISSDNFYTESPDYWKVWQDHGVLVVEMEAAALYTIAARHGVNALAILTVSDSLVTKAHESAEDRQKSYTQMFEIALEIAE